MKDDGSRMEEPVAMGISGFSCSVGYPMGLLSQCVILPQIAAKGQVCYTS